MEKVIIASENPVKINAVKIGFEKVFPLKQFEFIGVSVSSGVNFQPMSDNETLKGAKNRINNIKLKYPNADYWVGIEGGIEIVNLDMVTFAWIIIESKDILGKSKTSTFYLPKGIINLIKSGKELGEADDIFFNLNNSKKKSGSVGILTNNIITRTKLYEQSVILALIPFKNKEIY